MRKLANRWLQAVWYENNRSGFFLLPLAWLYQLIITARRFLYQYRIIQTEAFSISIIVVGNISVGGTGKTPLLIWLAKFLRSQGYRPGIISRGYGGQAQQWPQWVNAESDASQVGDEAIVIAVQTQCPMAVGPIRTDDVKMLQQQSNCNIILADDGLQHYALQRTVEIAVIDGERRFGNAHCLPAGPLREPVSRLQQIPLLIANGTAQRGEYAMKMIGNYAINLPTGEQKPLSDFKQRRCHAVAGIGNPQRFFKHLQAHGLRIKAHDFPDHHVYQAYDFAFSDTEAVLMTEKDAVKCTAFANSQFWFVPIQAAPDTAFGQQLLAILKEQENG